jgi:hypothetical protein
VVQGVIRRLVKWELSLWQVCLDEKGGTSSHVYLKDINMAKKEEINCKFKMAISKRSYA